MVHNLLGGLGSLLTPEAAGLLAVGMAVGMFMGMLPGLGVSLALSLMLPFLYHMSVVPAIALMLGAQASSYYGASITAILLNTPGAPESFPTTLDGYPMAERGEAGRALAISATSTLIGAWIACGILIGLLQIAGRLVSVFHPPEFVGIIVLALVLIGSTGESARASSVIISGAIGFMLSFVGSDPVTGVERFTFNLPALFSGISVVPFALGVFALTQMVLMFGRQESVAKTDTAGLARQFRGQVPQGIVETFRNWRDVVRSATVASILGLVPGIGGFTANFISYGLGRQTSRHRKEFGSGSPSGLVSAEGSSLAKEVGSLVPAVALGLPSGLGMVIFIAALSILGLQPGPTLLTSRPALPYTMMWVMAIAAAVSCSVGLAVTPWISRITSVRAPLLFPFILALSVLGSFAAVTSFAGVIELALFAGIGVVMRKLGYSLAAATIGLVLGATFADNVHLTGSIYGWHFVTRSPLADVFVVASFALLVLTALRARRTEVQHRHSKKPPHDAAEHPVLEPAADVAIASTCVAYMVLALGYPAGAGQLPAIVSALAGAVALSRLAHHVVLRRAGRRSREESAKQAAPGTAVLASVGGWDGGPGPSSQPSPAGSSPDSPLQPAAESSPVTARADTGRTWREVVALGWIFTAVLAAYLLGFELGVPAVVAGYCCVSTGAKNPKWKWTFTAAATGAGLGIAYAFVSLFHLTFSGLLINL